VTQPGNRTWTTVIEYINTSGWALPLFVILEGKVYLEYYYQQQGLLLDWTIGISNNSWTNNIQRFDFIQYFDK
jgi:hypothetical protein